MDRNELIEAMARAIANEIHECGDFGITGDDAYEARTDDFKAQAAAALSAIEAQGLAIVPVKMTEAQSMAAYIITEECMTYDDMGFGSFVDSEPMYRAMIEAGKV